MLPRACPWSSCCGAAASPAPGPTPPRGDPPPPHLRPRGGAEARGGGGGRDLREGARPCERPAVRITGVGRRSPTGPVDLHPGGAEEAGAARPRGSGREPGAGSPGRRRPPTCAARSPGLGGRALAARRPGSPPPHSPPPPRAGPEGRRSVEVWTRGAGLRAEAWTARPGDGGALCFSRGKGTPRAAVFGLPQRGVWTSALGKSGSCAVACLRKCP